MGKDLSITTRFYVFRSPVKIGGKWRCRKRHLTTGETTHTTLDATGAKDAREEVRQLAECQRAEELRAEQKDDRESTVRDAFVEWLGELSVRPATRAGYQRSTKSFQRLLGEDRLVSSLEYVDVGGLFADRWRDRSGRTKLMYHGFLVRWFDWCVKQGYCRENQARKVVVQREWKRQASRAAHTTGIGLSIEDARTFLDVCKVVSPSLWWYVFISLRTGLRKSNVLGSDYKPGLLWKNVDLEQGVLFIENEEFIKNGFPLRLPLHNELLKKLREVGPSRPGSLIVPDAGRPARKVHDFKVVGDLKKQFQEAKKEAAPRRTPPEGHEFHHRRRAGPWWWGCSRRRPVRKRTADRATHSHPMCEVKLASTARSWLEETTLGWGPAMTPARWGWPGLSASRGALSAPIRAGGPDAR